MPGHDELKGADRRPKQQTDERIRLDWLGALNCPGSRRIFGRMIYSATFGRSHTAGDPLNTAYQEGQRAAYVTIMNEIENAKPGETAVLLAENLKEKNHVE